MPDHAAGWRRLPAPGLAAGAALAIAVALAGVVGVLHLRHAGVALPGTRVAGVDVGGLDAAGIRARIETVAARREAAPVTLRVGATTATVTPEEAGFTVDRAATVRRALTAGRGGFLTTVAADVTSLWAGRDVDLVDTVDRARLTARIAALADRIDRKPSAGGVSVSPATLEVTTRPPAQGRTVRREQTVDLVARALSSPGPDTLDLPVDTAPAPVTAEAVRRVADEARAAVADDLVLAGGGVSVTLAARDLAPLLGLAVDGNQPHLAVDTAGVQSLVTSAAARVDQEPQEARVEITSAPPPTVDTQGDLTVTTQPATSRVTRESRTGRAVDVEKSATAAVAALRAGQHRAELTVEVTQPTLTTTEAGEVDELLSTFTTYHACCQDRVVNINTMAATVDGAVVGDGEVFSLNGYVGKRTKDKGYLPAPFILAGELVPDVGGGVSQFSTTTYNAAFFAGLPVLTHQPHSFYISRYPAGRESTLNYPTIDLKFRNDTGHALVIRTFTTQTSVTVALYGHSGGRTVRAITGPREPFPGGDFTIRVTREIRYADGRTSRDDFLTRYQKPPAGE